MRLVVLGRIASLAVAMLVVACFSAMPAYAAGCKGSRVKAHCYKVVKSAKHVTRSSSHYRHVHAAQSKKYTKRRHAKASHRHAHSSYAATRGCGCHKGHAKKWHGWTVTRHGAAFYHEGRRYDGGTPHGPAMWYNNGEGGFNAAVFWKLYERNLP